MKKILIVEDEKVFLKLLSAQLSKRGYRVFEADNGQKGLEEAKRENPDLILLDVRMPVMDGMTMLEQLRQVEVGKKMKVIILTNYEPDDRIVGQVMDDKPTYFFIKSNIELSFLFEKIAELLAE